MQDLNTAFIRNTANSYLSISFFSLLLAQGSPYGTERALKEHYIVIVFFLFAVLSYNILQHIATVTTMRRLQRKHSILKILKEKDRSRSIYY